jgi:hypothetical protein
MPINTTKQHKQTRFYFLHRCFVSSITAKILILDFTVCYIWVTRQELLPFESTWVHPRFLVGRVAHLFCVILLCVFTFCVPCCGVRYDRSYDPMSLQHIHINTNEGGDNTVVSPWHISTRYWISSRPFKQIHECVVILHTYQWIMIMID